MEIKEVRFGGLLSKEEAPDAIQPESPEDHMPGEPDPLENENGEVLTSHWHRIYKNKGNFLR